MIHGLVTPPAEEPIDLEEAKSFLRVSFSGDDDEITSQIAAGRRLCEHAARMSFCTQTRFAIYQLPQFFADTAYFLTDKLVDPDKINSGVRLLRGPVASLTSVEVYETADALTTVPANAYKFDANQGRIDWVPEYFTPLLSENSYLKVVYEAGMDKNTFRAMFPDIVQAILITVAAMYDEKGYSLQNVPSLAATMLTPYFFSGTYLKST